MNKRGFLGLIIFVLVALIVGLFFFVNWFNSSLPEPAECSVDSDCVPSSCCHAASCVAMELAPKCEGTFCSADCQPNTLDCGQGSCGCVEGKCLAVLE